MNKTLEGVVENYNKIDEAYPELETSILSNLTAFAPFVQRASDAVVAFKDGVTNTIDEEDHALRDESTDKVNRERELLEANFAERSKGLTSIVDGGF